jgi:Cyclin, N-terminal domain/Cyclin, C-terminal domain
VTSCFGFPNNFAVIAMNYFDRVLSRSNPLPNTKAEIQLLALSCFYLVVKLFQAGPILSPEQICMISGFAFSPSQIVDMEQMIILTLDWCLYPPTALEYLEPFLQILLKCSDLPLQTYASEIMATAEEFINEMTLDYYFIANQFLPSHVAVAALVNAIFTIMPKNNITLAIHDLSRMFSQICDYHIDEQDVVFCCERLLRLINATTSYEHSSDAKMSDPYETPDIQNIRYHSNSVTLRSPVTVTSYASVTSYTTDFKCHTLIGNFDGCGSMLIPPLTTSNQIISFTREY